MIDSWGPFYQASTWVLPVLLAITMHEVAHGFVAWHLGDDTAYQMKRVSCNPLRHIDPMGTVILPALLIILGAPFLFGWAKPVPVAFHRLRSPRSGMVFVALAGPVINLGLAISAALFVHGIIHMPDSSQAWALFNIQHAIQLNIMLTLFNMIPIPPLDGGRIIIGLLPPKMSKYVARFEKHGMFLLLILLFIIPTVGHQFGENWNLLAWLLGPFATTLYDLILRGTGLESLIETKAELI